MTRARVAALLSTMAVSVGLVTALAPAASAHPLGNFTHNTYVGFTVSADSIAVDHVLDLAEIPTFQERSAMDVDGDGTVSSDESEAWATARCASAASLIVATTNLGPVAWSVGSALVAFPEGEGGLPTTRLECGLTADTAGAATFDATADVAQGHVGWHEITVVGDGIAVTSEAPDASPSQRLTAYPTDGSTMDATSVAIGWGAAGVAPVAVQEPATELEDVDPANATAAALAPIGLDSAARAFTDLIGRQEVTIGFAMLAILIAVFLGGLHAMAPGHGKTMMAAALVGTSGRRRDAFALGASVTVSHTAGVVILAVVLTLSSAVAAESAYPWLGLVSAVIAVAVGVSLLRQARRGGHGHGHAHPHGHDHGHDHHDDHGHDHDDDHGHHGHDHDDHHGGHDHHGHDHHDHDHHDAAHGTLRLAAPATAPAAPRPATRRFIALGLAGGLVPSPSAVVVLLAGFALGRSWFALLLVFAYGVGMALTLCLTGLLLVRAGGLSRRLAEGTAVPRPIAAVLRLLPVIAAVTVVAAGLWLGFRSVLAL